MVMKCSAQEGYGVQEPIIREASITRSLLASLLAKNAIYFLGGVVCVGGGTAGLAGVGGGTAGLAGVGFLVFLNHLKHILMPPYLRCSKILYHLPLPCQASVGSKSNTVKVVKISQLRSSFLKFPLNDSIYPFSQCLHIAHQARG